MHLEVSVADALRRWPELNRRFEAEERPNEPKPASKGRRSKPFWDQAKPIALAWMDNHGCPKRNDWIRSRSAIASSYGKARLTSITQPRARDFFGIAEVREQWRAEAESRLVGEG
jgi:hypothetical protein